MPITIKNLAFTYSPKSPFQYEAIKDINLLINDHAFTAIIGHTGSGKSTLVQQINALLIPTQGALIVDGLLLTPTKKSKYCRQLKRVINHPKKYSALEREQALETFNFIEKVPPAKIKQLRQHVGIVFQFPEYQLFEETVIDDVAFGPLNFGLSKEAAFARAEKALLSVGLDVSYHQRSPFELSGGERRRVAIAGIIASEPQVLILDEPTAGLDPLGAKQMMDLFVQLYQTGTNIILVTHDMDIVLRYASDVVVMKEGRVIEETNPIALFSEDKEAYSLESPPLYQVARQLKERGFDIDVANMHSEAELAAMIKRGKK